MSTVPETPTSHQVEPISHPRSIELCECPPGLNPFLALARARAESHTLKVGDHQNLLPPHHLHQYKLGNIVEGRLSLTGLHISNDSPMWSLCDCSLAGFFPISSEIKRNPKSLMYLYLHLPFIARNQFWEAQNSLFPWKSSTPLFPIPQHSQFHYHLSKD